MEQNTKTNRGNMLDLHSVAQKCNLMTGCSQYLPERIESTKRYMSTVELFLCSFLRSKIVSFREK